MNIKKHGIEVDIQVVLLDLIVQKTFLIFAIFQLKFLNAKLMFIPYAPAVDFKESTLP